MSKKIKVSDALYSISGAAKKLERDRRTIEKAVDGLKPDAVSGGVKKWRLSRIVAGVDANTFVPVTRGKSSKGEQLSSGLAAAKSRLMKEQLFALQMKN